MLQKSKLCYQKTSEFLEGPSLPNGLSMQKGRREGQLRVKPSFNVVDFIPSTRKLDFIYSLRL